MGTQAYNDPGWKRQTAPPDDAERPLPAPEVKVMTGQEWYDRFEKEFIMLEPLMRMEFDTYIAIKKAAKHAAGLA